jgi:hypothetical protein
MRSEDTKGKYSLLALILYPLSYPLQLYIPMCANVIAGSNARCATTNGDHPHRLSSDKADHSTKSNSTTLGDVTTMAHEGEAIAKGISPLLQQLIEEVTDCSALKMRKAVAQREFDKRQAEFNCSAEMHERFPATREAQTKSKARAELDLKSISEEVGTKKSVLSDLASQSFSHIIPHILAASAQSGRQAWQERIKVLERKCEDFRKESDNHKRVMGDLQKSHEEKDKLFEDRLRDLQDRFEESERRSEAKQRATEYLLKDQEDKYRVLEESYSKLSDECGHTKAILTKDCQPQIASAIARVIQSEAITNTLSRDLVATRELAGQLEDSVARDLRPKLEKLSHIPEHIAILPRLRSHLDMVRKESGNSSKDLARHLKNIEQLGGYYEKINGFDRILNGTGSPYSKGLSANVNELINQKESEAARSQSLKQLEERLNTSAFETRLDKVESQISEVKTLSATLSELKGDVANGDSKLRVVEAQKSPAPTTPSIDFETLKSEILEIVEMKQAAGDSVIAGISTRLQTAIDVHRDRLEAVEKNCSDMKTVYDPLTTVPAQVERLKTSLDSRGTQLDEATDKIFDSIRLRPELLPLAVIEGHILKAIENKLDLISKFDSQAMFDQLEANAEALVAVDRRLNNLNTKHMAMFIIKQMEGIYPDARNVTTLLNELKTQVEALETRILPSSSNEKSLQLLRGEVDKLALNIGKAQGVANAAKKLGDAAATQAETTKLQNDIAEELGSFRLDLEEIQRLHGTVEKLQEGLKKLQEAKAPAIISAAQRAPTSARLGQSQPHPFVQDDRGHKKRKLNSSLLSTGRRQSLKVPNGGPRKKRHKFGIYEVDEDDSEDSTFEPNQPSISDDEEEP